eukprot:TRINITY_DN2988_c0_g1_i1.p1 TRINITY_DN2988_c0_g1~~TRINITY_DN2988_c0_g1_i1.p1  ORF type:complete len:203 (-),score=51.25 TRINITY_DN2988_c0_g1_i1:49-657(-)
MSHLYKQTQGADHGPSFGLSAELQQKRDATYNTNLEQEARDWIEAVTGDSIGPDFFTGLKDGVILCNLANKLLPGSVKKINKTKLPFHQMENIGNFLTAATKYGVPASDMFQTVDLYEQKNKSQVIQGIHSLGRAAQAKKFSGPVLGVKPSEKHNVEFTREKMEAGKGELGLLNKGALNMTKVQSAVTVDRSRDVVRHTDKN